MVDQPFNDVAQATEANAEGTFSILDDTFSSYPDQVIPRPKGPFRLLEGEEKEAARKAANTANQAMRRADPAAYAGKEIHEIHPVKFGGSPTDPQNKVALEAGVHRTLVTPWWNRLMRSLTGD